MLLNTAPRETLIFAVYGVLIHPRENTQGTQQKALKTQTVKPFFTASAIFQHPPKYSYYSQIVTNIYGK